MNSQNLKRAHFSQLEISSGTVDFILVIADTTAAPALYIVDQLSILSRCVDLWNIPIHNEDFHTYSAAIGCGHIYDVTKV